MNAPRLSEPQLPLNSVLPAERSVFNCKPETKAGLGALTQSSYWVIAIESVPSRTATAVGFINTGFNLGGVCSPILTPWIAARYGWSTALTVAAIASVAVAILWKFIDDSTRAFGAHFARPVLPRKPATN